MGVAFIGAFRDTCFVRFSRWLHSLEDGNNG